MNSEFSIPFNLSKRNLDKAFKHQRENRKVYSQKCVYLKEEKT